MHIFLVLLLTILSVSDAKIKCPLNDYPICGSDGMTYRNLCDWKMANVVRPELRLQDIGPCRLENNRYLYQTLPQKVYETNGKVYENKNRQSMSSEINRMGRQLVKMADILYNLESSTRQGRKQQLNSEFKQLWNVGNILRSSGVKKKHAKRSKKSIHKDLMKSLDIVERLAALPFNFRRDQSNEEDEEEVYK